MKFKIILLIAILIPFYNLAQTNSSSLSGHLAGYGVKDKVFLSYKNLNERILDSVALDEHGRFNYSHQVAEPALVTMSVGKNLVEARRSKPIYIYLENSEVRLESADSLKKNSIQGGVTNEEYLVLQSQLSKLDYLKEAIIEKYQKATEEERDSEKFVKESSEMNNQYREKSKAVLIAFIKENPASFVSLDKLSEVVGYTPEASDITFYFKDLNPKIKQSQKGLFLAKQISLLEKVAIGSLAPGFSQTDVNGKLVNLKDFAGQYVLIDFWASWCGPCRRENPHVVQAYADLKESNFTVLGISLDRPGKKEDWLSAIQQDGLVWTQLSDLKFWNNEVAQLYNVRSIPQNFLIDPAGVIIAKNLRGEDLTEKIKQYLK